MDIVYLVKDCYLNEELTYSLRSLKNIPHDKVFIVGGFPTNLKRESLVHIPVLQGNNKYRNTTNNLKHICSNKAISEDFILMNDDFFILKPVVPEELNLCRGYIDDVICEYVRRYGEFYSQYIREMKQAKIFLEDLGIKKPLSYELHIPMVINKQKFLDIFSIPHIDALGDNSQKRSIYGNLYCKNSKVINDVKVFNDYFYPLGSDKFLSTEDNSWSKTKQYVNSLFPEKSIYEI